MYDVTPASQPLLCTALQVQAGADDGIRTRDLRFTKPLLYQLSYVGFFTLTALFS